MMNQWWLLFCLVILMAVGFVGYRYGADSTEVSCQKQVEAEQAHVIGQIETQNQITQGVSNAYHTGISAIDNLYGVQQLPGGIKRTISTPACGTQASKKYKLTPQECDDEEFKCIALWNWTQQQGDVK
jgi:hypothetical protein